MSSINTCESDHTRTEAVVAAHECDWACDGDQGRCACGLIVASEDEWARYAEQAVASELWSPSREIVNSNSIRYLVLRAPTGAAIRSSPGRGADRVR